MPEPLREPLRPAPIHHSEGKALGNRTTRPDLTVHEGGNTNPAGKFEDLDVMTDIAITELAATTREGTLLPAVENMTDAIDTGRDEMERTDRVYQHYDEITDTSTVKTRFELPKTSEAATIPDSFTEADPDNRNKDKSLLGGDPTVTVDFTPPPPAVENPNPTRIKLETMIDVENWQPSEANLQIIVGALPNLYDDAYKGILPPNLGEHIFIDNNGSCETQIRAMIQEQYQSNTEKLENALGALQHWKDYVVEAYRNREAPTYSVAVATAEAANPATAEIIDNWLTRAASLSVLKSLEIMPRDPKDERQPWDEKSTLDPETEKTVEAATSLLSKGWEAVRTRVSRIINHPDQKVATRRKWGASLGLGVVGAFATLALTGHMMSSFQTNLEKSLGLGNTTEQR